MMNFSAGLFSLLLGLTLLMWGRHLFWLFVAGMGCVFGFRLAAELGANASQWSGLGIALFLGLLGAALAYFLKRAMIFGAGFLGGGYLAISWVQIFFPETGSWFWAVLLGGGLAGGFFAALVFDWALMILSSLFGATLIAQNVPVAGTVEAVLIAVLAVIGLAAQLALGTKPEEPAARKPRRR